MNTKLEEKKKWSLLGDTDTELLTDEEGVLSLVVVLRPAIITIMFHPSLNSSHHMSRSIAIFNIIVIVIITIIIILFVPAITLSFSLPSLLASLVLPVDPSLEPLDSFVGLVLDPP